MSLFSCTCFFDFFKTVVLLDIHGNQYAAGNNENISKTVDKAVKKLNFIQAFYLSKLELVKTFLKVNFVLMK